MKYEPDVANPQIPPGQVNSLTTQLSGVVCPTIAWVPWPHFRWDMVSKWILDNHTNGGIYFFTCMYTHLFLAECWKMTRSLSSLFFSEAFLFHLRALFLLGCCPSSFDFYHVGKWFNLGLVRNHNLCIYWYSQLFGPVMSCCLSE